MKEKNREQWNEIMSNAHKKRIQMKNRKYNKLLYNPTKKINLKRLRDMEGSMVFKNKKEKREYIENHPYKYPTPLREGERLNIKNIIFIAKKIILREKYLKIG